MDEARDDADSDRAGVGLEAFGTGCETVVGVVAAGGMNGKLVVPVVSAMGGEDGAGMEGLEYEAEVGVGTGVVWVEVFRAPRLLLAVVREERDREAGWLRVVRWWRLPW